MEDTIGSLLLEYIIAHSNSNPPIEFIEPDTQEPKRQINWPRETLDILEGYCLKFSYRLFQTHTSFHVQVCLSSIFDCINFQVGANLTSILIPLKKKSKNFLLALDWVLNKSHVGWRTMRSALFKLLCTLTILQLMTRHIKTLFPRKCLSIR